MEPLETTAIIVDDNFKKCMSDILLNGKQKNEEHLDSNTQQ
jgi:hypothetical protein